MNTTQHTDNTPAPLDPSKVKAGDTVTLTFRTASITDTVSHTPAAEGHINLKHAGTFPIGGGSVWTLTAHQPAPEPEPEFKPGTVFVDDGGERYFVVAIDSKNTLLVDDVDDRYAPDEPEGLRPLVVIDPAEVDVDALYDVFSESTDPRQGLREALAELGIEAS